MTTKVSLAAAAAAVVAAHGLACAQNSWRVEFLQAPPGHIPESRAINNHGTAAGTIDSGVSVGAFVWAAGGAPAPMSGGPIADYYWCHHVADDGAVVGTMRLGQEDAAFRWTAAGGITPIMTVPGQGSSSEAHGVNAAGAVAGAINLKAVRWTAAGGATVIEFPGAPAHVNYGGALAINDAGVVVGFAGHPGGGQLAQPDVQAFRWTEAGGIEALVFIGGCFSVANDVNASGDIVGVASTECPASPETPEKPWLWRNGVVTVLTDPAGPTSGHALAINDGGMVLGFDGFWGGIGLPQQDYWVWKEGVKTFLDDAVALPAGWEIQEVMDLNNAGVMVARLISPTESRAALLVPNAACYANCDGSVQPPVLNVQDFSCFLTRYAAGESYANCDGSVQPPVLNVQDFSCFLTRYAAGCR